MATRQSRHLCSAAQFVCPRTPQLRCRIAPPKKRFASTTTEERTGSLSPDNPAEGVISEASQQDVLPVLSAVSPGHAPSNKAPASGAASANETQFNEADLIQEFARTRLDPFKNPYLDPYNDTYNDPYRKASGKSSRQDHLQTSFEASKAESIYGNLLPLTSGPTQYIQPRHEIQRKRRKEAKLNPQLSTEMEKVGRVVAAGQMAKTAHVKIATIRWDPYLRKYFKSTLTYLVHDPTSSLRAGDIIAFAPLPEPRTDHVRNVVTSIRVPFGTEAKARTPLPSYEKAVDMQRKKGRDQRDRRNLRAQAAAGNKLAKKKVKELGIGVRVVKSGTGRGISRRGVLMRDVRAGKGGKAKVPQGRVRT